MNTRTPQQYPTHTLRQYHFAQQETSPMPVKSDEIPLTTETWPDQQPIIPLEVLTTTTADKKKQWRLRIIGCVVTLALATTFYFIWRPATPMTTAASPTAVNVSNIPSNNLPTTSTNTPLSTGTTSASITNSSGSTSTIQAYIVGAIHHAGVYSLTTDARVYQLLQAAGGPLPTANLAALNLAARVNDGEEVYVAAIGETPPAAVNIATSASSSSATTSTATITSTTGGTSLTNQGQTVNINTADLTTLRQQLHLSSKSAQTIITYRLQHGSFTSVDQLLQVISKAIYTRIKGMVTV